MQKIFKNYVKQAKKDYSQIYFFYTGNYYSYYTIGNKTVNEFANIIDKKANGMSITVTDSEEESKEELNEEPKENPKDIKEVKIITINIENTPEVYYNIVFHYEGSSATLKVEENEKMKDIIWRYTKSIIKLDDPNMVYFLYGSGTFFYDNKGNIEVQDFGDKTVKEFVNYDDEKRKGMAIVVYNNDFGLEEFNQDTSMKGINTNDYSYMSLNLEEKPIHIIFIYEGHPFPLKVEGNEKIKDAINRYISEIKGDINDLEFYYKNNKLNIDIIGDKTVEAISYVSEKIEPEKKIDVIVKKKERLDDINSNNIINEENDNLRESLNFFNESNNEFDDDDLIEGYNGRDRLKKNKYEISLENRFHIKNFIILFIQ